MTAPDPPRPDPSRPDRPRPVALVYTISRLLIFIAVLGVLWLARVRGLLALLLAIVLSGAISYVLLARQRTAMARRIEDRVQRRRAARPPRPERPARRGAPDRTADPDRTGGSGRPTPE